MFGRGSARDGHVCSSVKRKGRLARPSKSQTGGLLLERKINRGLATVSPGFYLIRNLIVLVEAVDT